MLYDSFDVWRARKIIITSLAEGCEYETRPNFPRVLVIRSKCTRCSSDLLKLQTNVYFSFRIPYPNLYLTTGFRGCTYILLNGRIWLNVKKRHMRESFIKKKEKKRRNLNSGLPSNTGLRTRELWIQQNVQLWGDTLLLPKTVYVLLNI
jgi:hypothetical protein